MTNSYLNSQAVNPENAADNWMSYGYYHGCAFLTEYYLKHRVLLSTDEIVNSLIPLRAKTNHYAATLGIKPPYNEEELNPWKREIKSSQDSSSRVVEESSKNTFVYFIQCTRTKYIKIGYSTDPERRRKQLQGLSSSALRLLKKIPGNRQKEQELHKQFKFCRTDREWFTPAEALIEFIDSLEGA